MTTYNAKVYFNGDGATTQFAVPFPYILKTHVHVFVNGAEVAISSWPSGSMLQLGSAPVAGSLNIEIRRITPNDAILHAIQTGTILPADINVDNTQLLYILQELGDALHGPLDLDGHKITNLGDGTLGTDAANIETVNALITTALHQGTVVGSAPVFASYGAARAVSASVLANNMVAYFRGGAADQDGGEGFFRVTNSNPGYADDGGTVIAHSGGAFWFKRLMTNYISVNWFLPPYGVTDAGPAIRAALAAASQWKISEVQFYGDLRVNTQIVNASTGWLLPAGLRFRGVGMMHSANAVAPLTSENAQIVCQGTPGTYVFDLRDSDSVGVGNLTNITFQDFAVFNTVDVGFIAINQLRRNGAAFTCGVNPCPGFAAGIKFKNVHASGTFGMSFLRAKEVFELEIDHNCEVNNWFRGVWLTGCDDAFIGGRYDGNSSRHIMMEKDGTFGNQPVVRPNFLGAIGGSDATENHYGIYDTSEGATLQSLYIEADGVACYAGMFLGGAGTCILNPHIFSSTGNALRLFHLGANAVNITMINPETATAASCAAPQIEAATILLYTASGHDDYFMKIINPSTNITSKVTKAQRCRVMMGSTKLGAYSGAYIPVMGLSANGPGIRRYTIHAQNPGNATPLTGVGVSAIAVDAAAKNYAGQALQIAAVNGDGFYMEFTCGNDFQIGDSITFKALCRCSAVPSSGNLRVSFFKNGVEAGTPTTTALGVHSILTDTISTAGYVAGDTLRVVVKNATLVGANGLVGMIEVTNNS